MLSVQNLVKRYETEAGQPAGGVFDVSFEVKPGEMFTLLGPSGCGKTTTLRCIAGLETPDNGTIALAEKSLFDGNTGAAIAMYDRDIGMVFQSYAIWPHMNVFENAAYPLRVSRATRYSRADIEKRVVRVLEIVGLASYRSRSATKLSGGQQQRLALARALVREPQLLLLDEPLSNLDAQLREQMRAELKRIQLEWGVTTIYVTHDQAEAMAISDRIAVLNQGLIMQVGTPDEIYDVPNSEFVAHFIGRTNLFRGKLETAVEAGGTGLVMSEIGPIRCRFAKTSTAGQDISFVVRPENVELQRSDPAAAAVTENFVDGQVTGRVYLGDIAEYTVDLGGRFKLLARSHPGLRIAPGDKVRVHLPAERTIAIHA
ncbi:MAG TPA: ABC transporter ATP-binding protein [Beijerinckiaceae bacterium]|jgi:iron(III) transport system ATP-binding protein|nr:ABC transporter ATP-binding protein [Beijerinckiaceae bacterium]